MKVIISHIILKKKVWIELQVGSPYFFHFSLILFQLLIKLNGLEYSKNQLYQQDDQLLIILAKDLANYTGCLDTCQAAPLLPWIHADPNSLTQQHTTQYSSTERHTTYFSSTQQLVPAAQRPKVQKVSFVARWWLSFSNWIFHSRPHQIYFPSNLKP